MIEEIEIQVKKELKRGAKDSLVRLEGRATGRRLLGGGGQ